MAGRSSLLAWVRRSLATHGSRRGPCDAAAAKCLCATRDSSRPIPSSDLSSRALGACARFRSGTRNAGRASPPKGMRGSHERQGARGARPTVLRSLRGHQGSPRGRWKEGCVMGDWNTAIKGWRSNDASRNAHLAADAEEAHLAKVHACPCFEQPSQWELECIHCEGFRDQHARGRRGKEPGQ